MNARSLREHLEDLLQRIPPRAEFGQLQGDVASEAERRGAPVAAVFARHFLFALGEQADVHRELLQGLRAHFCREG